MSDNNYDNNEEELPGNTPVSYTDGVTISFNIHNNAINPLIHIQNSPEAGDIVAAILKDLHETTLGLKLVTSMVEHHENVPQDRAAMENAMSQYEKFILDFNREMEGYEEELDGSQEASLDPWPDGPLVRPTQVFQE